MLARTQTGQNAHMAAEGLFRIGWIYFFLHNPRLAQKHLSDAREQARESGQAQIYLKATSFLGSLHLVLGKFQTARQLLMEARDLSREPTGVEANAWTLASLIKHYNWTGEFEEALRLCEDLDALNQQLQSRYFENFLVFQRGLIYSAMGRFQAAERILKKGVAQWEQGDKLFWRPRMLNTLAWLMALQDKPRQALSLNREALAEALESGDPETIYNARINMAENFLQMNDLERAKQEIEAVWREIRYQRELYSIWRFKTRARLALARLYLALGDVPAASRHALGAYRTALETGATKHQAMALHIRARIIRRSNPKKAALLMDQALSLANKMKTPWLLKIMAAEKNES
jgi:tetratricopeptide (TPR) repeat protein